MNNNLLVKGDLLILIKWVNEIHALTTDTDVKSYLEILAIKLSVMKDQANE